MRRTIVVLAALAWLLVGTAIPVQAEPPDSSGIVTRGDGALLYWAFDAEVGASVFLGADPLELCVGVIELDVIDLQEIDVPDDRNRFLEMLRGEVTTSVWPFVITGPAECPKFFTTEPLATGVSDVVWTDNDARIFANPDNRNHNAFGFAARGTLIGPDGEELRFSAHERITWDGHDFAASAKSSVKINLH